MTTKTASDKEKPAYPWTARQKRAKIGTRLTRKQNRHAKGKRR